MNKIYYDPTGGFLYGIDSNNQPKIVKTDACVMMPENVFVDSNGYIHVKNLDDTETIIQDELGNPASIMGPAGPTGQTGSPGILGPAGNDGKDGASIKLIDSLLNLELTGQTAYIYMLTEDDYDEAIGKVEAGSLYEHTGNAWAYKFSIKGPKGDTGELGAPGQNGTNGADGVDGLTPFISENGNWWIGTTDTGVQAEGKDGKNPFTEEETATLKALPETVSIAQSKNEKQFQSISEQIKVVSDSVSSTHNRIGVLEAKLAELEQVLSKIDLTSLTADYPKPEPEPPFNFITSCVVKDEASYQNLPESYRSQYGEWDTPGLLESLPWLTVLFDPIPAKYLQIKVTGPNNFEKEISYPDIEKEVTLLTLNAEELKTELITGPWTININGTQTTLIVDRSVEG